ncbi:BZ3500_MvSof-1268-A1-R1_Chr11-3g03520 [Microbotryum saponariae]|uniref:BZ3500_MvSof-1268-A1-R1_Chr11-3g03520 protein n=1 Tax=Microbotryum saponariae TaxID=289078 RepID=A0A2X0L7Z4_9BASI|nr:BZ3500_MvSof-1268-A1-R1_Chr11-3g03520 [Microbotryum saponariae]SDA03529.1 BZ3501_MvSof-1269-A2-R1_Chr11g03097 [Microbotryum saponariae]
MCNISRFEDVVVLELDKVSKGLKLMSNWRNRAPVSSTGRPNGERSASSGPAPCKLGRGGRRPHRIRDDGHELAETLDADQAEGARTIHIESLVQPPDVHGNWEDIDQRKQSLLLQRRYT